MDEREERSERISQEVEQGSQDPVREATGDDEALLVGRADRVAGRAAGIATADTEPHCTGEKLDVELSGMPAPETGRGDTITLDGDAKRQMHLGEEIAVRLPAGSPDQEPWSYEIEGDYRALDVYQRATLLTGAGTETQAPGASGGSQFLVRAAQRGKATVRFERTGDRALRLKLKVR